MPIERDTKGRFVKQYFEINNCIDCSSEIQRWSKRCHGCNARFMNTGRKHSEETKLKKSKSMLKIGDKLSANMKEKWKNPEYRKHMSDVHIGIPTWNKGIKTGLVPKTAFKKGNISWTSGTGMAKGKRRRIKIINGRKTLVSHINWRSQKDNLPFVPTGCVIHHLDLNPENDNPNNLLLLDRSTHGKIHTKIAKVLLCR